MSEDDLVAHVDRFIRLKERMFADHYRAWVEDQCREYIARFWDKLKHDLALYILELYQQGDQASDM